MRPFIKAIAIIRASYERRGKRLAERGLLGYLFGRRGYVLIIVLLVTSLLVSVSSEFLITAQTDVHYIRKFSEKLKAQMIARAGLTIGAMLLEADKRGIGAGIIPGSSGNSSIDTWQDIWAIEYPELPLENGFLKIRITDENAKINLSVLANEATDKSVYYSITQRFFLNMGLPMDLADTLIDWVDVDDARFPYGAESADYYITLPSPYKAKNAEMDSIQEMLLVKLITPEIYYGLGGGNFGRETGLVEDNRGRRIDSSTLMKALPEGKDAPMPAETRFDDLSLPIGRERSRRLSDYFRVHGERTDFTSELNKINVNTASYRVLSAISDDMTDDVVTQIIRRRQQQPYTSVDELSDFVPDETVRKNVLGVRSYIFLLEITGRISDTRTVIRAFYNRETKKFYSMAEQ